MHGLESWESNLSLHYLIAGKTGWIVTLYIHYFFFLCNDMFVSITYLNLSDKKLYNPL